jgi:hypothetical protein
VRQGRRVRRAPHARCDAHTCRQLRLTHVHLGAERERLIEFRSEVLGDPRALGHDVRVGAELFAPRRDDGCALSSLTVIVAPTMGIFALSMSQCVGRRLYNGEVRRLAAVIVTTVFALPNASDGRHLAALTVARTRSAEPQGLQTALC